MRWRSDDGFFEKDRREEKSAKKNCMLVTIRSCQQKARDSDRSHESPSGIRLDLTLEKQQNVLFKVFEIT